MNASAERQRWHAHESFSPLLSSLAGLRDSDMSAGFIALIDAWALIAVMWGSRLIAGSVDAASAVFALALLASLTGTRSSSGRLHATALDDVGLMLSRSVLCFAAAAALTTLTGIGDQTLLLFTAASSAVALSAARILSRRVELGMSRGGKPAGVLIIGAGQVARQVIKAANQRREYGLEVVGAVDDDPRFDEERLGAPVLGRLNDTVRILRERDIRILVVAFSQTNPGEMVRVIREAQAGGVSVWVVPRFFELGSSGGARELLWGLPLACLAPPAPQHPQWAFKRLLDLVGASVGLLFGLPVMAVCALAVLVESGRPVLHRQTRISRNGREFTILKFRTMEQASPNVERTEWSADPLRVTRVGSFLRDRSLDELPQLFNVLRGDMSIVGPRPERPHFVGLFSQQHRHYADRHRVPAGITGWAQIHGLRGSNSSIEERVVFDNNYIDGWSMTEDAKIMVKTIKALTGHDD